MSVAGACCPEIRTNPALELTELFIFSFNFRRCVCLSEWTPERDAFDAHLRVPKGLMRLD